MEKIYRIDSKLFYRLYEKGGFGLVACFSRLKYFQNTQECYKPIKHKTNNKTTKGYRLMSRFSGISIPTLKNLVPILEEMDLVHFDKKGGVHLAGRKKTDTIGGKLVPIKMGDKFTDTKTFASYVIIRSNLDRQKKQFEKKRRLSEGMRAIKNGSFISKKVYKLIKSLEKEGIKSIKDLKMVENRILSNAKIANLVGVDYKEDTQKSNGSYFKRRFKDFGLIESRRRFRKIHDERVSFSEYSKWRDLYRSNQDNVTWKNGFISEEIASEVNDTSDMVTLVNMETGEIVKFPPPSKFSKELPYPYSSSLYSIL